MYGCFIRPEKETTMTSKPPRPYFQVDTNSIKGEFFYSDFFDVKVEATDFSPQEWRQISKVFKEPLTISTVIRVILTVVMILVTYLLLSHGSMSLLGVLAGLAGALTALVSFRLAFLSLKAAITLMVVTIRFWKMIHQNQKECEQR
jgi:hypothetical protein